ncbi:phage terminase large subunit (plasmid) [Azospirillum sp. HJ39]|uniref:phage terminase large subunit n=1 Tax=Azospirillum sp. HJ39 TaxID=3159496 RepID=UPI0035566A15
MRPEELLAHRDAIEKALCERSFYAFLKHAWSSIDPADFVDGWHLRVICDKLEKAARGEIRNLVVCIPPRHSKTLIISVAFPCWVWSWWPSAQFICTSYAASLSVDSSVKARGLIESPWYQRHWGGVVELVADQNQKQYYKTTAGGHRFSTSVGGIITGKGGDFVLCDDPHNVADAESETTRTEAVRWWRESVPTRLNDPKTGRKLVIQQRVHEKDVAGYCISTGYDHLVLPAEFEHNHPHRSPLDPRTEDGELLCPARFGRAEVDGLKRDLGSYAAAGQLQQRPAPRDGGMFKRTWFTIVPAAPAVARRVRCWDLAATSSAQSEDPDWTAGVKMARDAAGIFYVEDVRRMRETSWQVERAILNTASTDGKSVPIGMPQDPGAAGKAQAAYMVRQLAGYIVKIESETGSKETRAAPFAAQAEAGNVMLVKGDWNDAFIDELCSFPNAAHDDQVDAAAGAFRRLLDGGTTGLLDFYAAMATQQYLEERIKRLTPIERTALHYIDNAGGRPTIAQFDDDHDPIGSRLRADLLRDGWIHETDGHLSLADGVAAALTRKD